MKVNFESEKDKLKSLIKTKFAKPINSQKSFEELSELTKLSSQTLRRFFGKIEQNHKTSTTTLSLLSKFVDFQDWSHFLQQIDNEKTISERDKILIESMSTFFKNGEKYNTYYFQKTNTVDTLNDYAKTIYSCKENVEYFYALYQNNNWATDYILAWIPNYNYYGQEWFRKILFDKSQKTKISHVKLVQINFLHFGAFLSESNFNFTENFKKLQIYYSEYKKDFGYLPYHEMRYCTIRLIEAKRNNQKINRIISEYLQNLKEQKYSQENFQELLIFFCNTLFWLQEYEIAYEIIKTAKPYLKNLKGVSKQKALHYYGLNMAFIKITFALIYLANGKEIKDFIIKSEDFNDYADLLYHDYIQVMYLSKCILSENGLEHKKKLFAELKHFVEKTNYTQIYNILEDLDIAYSKYCA
ncbi:hypothetical protein [Chryseobacterium sp. T1]